MRHIVLALLMLLAALPVLAQESDSLTISDIRVRPDDVETATGETQTPRPIYVFDKINVQFTVMNNSDTPLSSLYYCVIFRVIDEDRGTILLEKIVDNNSSPVHTIAPDGLPDRGSHLVSLVTSDLPAAEYDQVEIQIANQENALDCIQPIIEPTLEVTESAIPEAVPEETPEAPASTSEGDDPGTDDAGVMPLLEFTATEPLRGANELIVRSNLPPAVEQLLAALALFAGTMLVMAAGTEVIVDMLRSLIGLERRTTATEAFKQVREQLPGALAELGVSTEKIRLAYALLDRVQDISVKGDSLLEIANSLRQGNLREIYQYLFELRNDPANDLDAFEDKLDDKIKGFIDKIANTLGVPEMTSKVKEQIRDIKRDDLSEAYKNLKGDPGNKDLQEKFEKAAKDYLKQISHLIQQSGLDAAYRWVEKQITTNSNLTQEQLIQQVRGNKAISDLLSSLNLSDNQVVSLIDDSFNVVRGLSFTATKELLQQVWRSRVETTSWIIRAIRYPYERHDRTNKKLTNIKFDDIFKPKKWRDKFAVSTFLIAIVLGLIAILLPDTTVYICLIVVGIGGIAIVVHEKLVNSERINWRDRSAAVLHAALLVGFMVLIHAILPSKLTSLGDPFDTIVLVWAASALGAFGVFEVSVYLLVTGEKRNPTDDLNTIGGITKLGRVLVEVENQFRKDENLRIRSIRILTVIIGIIMARIAQVDSAVFFEDALPGFATGLTNTRIPLLSNLGITPGILLTGLAASAGSAFWHDVLDRLRAVKQQAESAARLVRQAQEMGESA